MPHSGKLEAPMAERSASDTSESLATLHADGMHWKHPSIFELLLPPEKVSVILRAM
jgi:hypothetical protein